MLNYYNPVKIIKTLSWSHELNFRIEDLKISAPIIVTSKGNRKRLSLDSKFDPDSIFSDVGNNPNFKNCLNAIKFCQKNLFNGVIAIGGGSVMDLAKVVMAYLCLEKPDIYELIDYKGKFPQTIPSIFIPTTHGTGSEVTMWGTIWDMKEKKKHSISHKNLYPSLAILDGNLALSLPLDISIITVMDALSHSFEAIWNKNANVKSTNYAIQAISIILENIKPFKKKYADVNLRHNLLLASNIAGLAFSNTKTAAAHSISYPLTIYYGIPHGIASSMSLLPLLEINKNSIKDSINKICKKNKITYSQLIQNIKSIPQNIIPYKLRDWGITEKNLNKLVDASFTKGRMDNNIVDLCSTDVMNIFQSLL